MSALFGLYRLRKDGARPEADQNTRRALALLEERRGAIPDGGEYRDEDVVLAGFGGLGNLYSDAQGLTIAADARIDNRDYLIAELKLPRHLPDAALILYAYRRWDLDCAGELLGDFAFVLWDAGRRRVMCARDHFGVRPLYYCHVPRTAFACATDISPLLCLDAVPRRLSYAAVANYLERVADDPAATFYQDVLRLPPACRLTVEADSAAIVHKYWQPDPERELLLGSDAEYAQAYLDVFSRAVTCRMSTDAGATLSGGLDSSSIVAVARTVQPVGKQLPVFPAVFDDVPESDEREFIQAVTAQGGTEPHFVRADRIGPLDDLDAMFDCVEQPFDAPNFFVHWNLYRTAAACGVRVILDGDGGDITVSHGVGRLAELFARGRWLRLYSEARALSESMERPVRRLLARHALRPFVPGWLRGLRGGERRGPQDPVWSPDAVLAPELIRSAWPQLKARALELHNAPPPRSARQVQYRELTGDLIPSELELFNKGAAGVGIQSRHPFFDKRLVEFCLALPAHQKLSGGYTRAVARRAMQGLLPHQVCWRRDKGDFSPNFLAAMRRQTAQLKILLYDAAPGSLPDFVDMKRTDLLYRQLAEGSATAYQAYLLWKVATLSGWLHRSGF